MRKAILAAAAVVVVVVVGSASPGGRGPRRRRDRARGSCGDATYELSVGERGRRPRGVLRAPVRRRRRDLARGHRAGRHRRPRGRAARPTRTPSSTSTSPLDEDDSDELHRDGDPASSGDALRRHARPADPPINPTHEEHPMKKHHRPDRRRPGGRHRAALLAAAPAHADGPEQHAHGSVAGARYEHRSTEKDARLRGRASTSTACRPARPGRSCVKHDGQADRQPDRTRRPRRRRYEVDFARRPQPNTAGKDTFR